MQPETLEAFSRGFDAGNYGNAYEAEANAAGRRTAEEYAARSLHPHGWKVEVFCPCCIRGTTYRGRTCEPGYRRKPCSFCDGTGRITS